MLPWSLFLALAACQGGQWSPYAEVQTRDENLGSHQPTNTYDGETFMVGVRWVPPTRFDENQLVRIEAALRAPTVGGQPIEHAPIVIDHKDAQENDLATTLVDKGSNVKTWTGVAGLLAIALILWIILWRRRASSVPTSPGQEPSP